MWKWETERFLIIYFLYKHIKIINEYYKKNINFFFHAKYMLKIQVIGISIARRNGFKLARVHVNDGII